MPVTVSMARSDRNIGAEDRRFLESFEQCTLPESEWTHLAHIRVAWTCLQESDPAEAVARIRRGILRYNTNVLGRPEMYHDTVTIAFSRLIADRMRPGETWDGFARRIDDLLDGKSPILLRYYSGGRLFSDEARDQFVEPDLNALPAQS
jgi:hypothetical protein